MQTVIVAIVFNIKPIGVATKKLKRNLFDEKKGIYFVKKTWLDTKPVIKLSFTKKQEGDIMKRSLMTKLVLCLIVVAVVSVSGILVAMPSYKDILNRCHRYCSIEYPNHYFAYNACLSGCVYGATTNPEN